MKNHQLLLATLLAFCFISCNQKIKEEAIPKISKADKTAMLLAVYHFDNPGKDTYNVEVDDYFSEKRQNEIQELTKSLSSFKPNKIFVEFSPQKQPEIDSLYGLYLQDKIKLSDIKGGRNEVYQIGFRLGKEVGVQKILAIDHDGNWLGDYVDFIADTLAFQDYLSNAATQATTAKSKQEQINRNTVKENLLFYNSWEQVAQNHDYYNRFAIKVKDTVGIMFTNQQKEEEINGLPYSLRSFDFENIGVELIAEWYKRNLFIYRNILENTEPSDKVLIIFGQGHVRYLHQMLDDNPTFELVSPTHYLNLP